MTRKMMLAAALLTLFVVALAGTRKANAAPPKDACSLLTPVQVSGVLGVPAAGRSLGPKTCMWVQTGVKPGSPRRRADLLMLEMQGFVQASAVAKMPNSPTSATPVSGLGDDAYYLSMTSGRPFTELRVKKGSVAFGIRVESSGTPFTADQIKAKEKTLAQDVLANL